MAQSPFTNAYSLQRPALVAGAFEEVSICLDGEKQDVPGMYLIPSGKAGW